MKKAAAIVLAMGLASIGMADPIYGITNIFPGYVYASATEGTNLDSGVEYVCIPRTELWTMTAAQCSSSNATSDARALVYSLVKEAHDFWYAQDTTNKPAMLTVLETASYEGGTNTIIIFQHRVQTKMQVVSGAVSIPAE
jgi:hypothetical protein